ncbi:MAG: orotidine-5'-phosphate decarboxylase, partial [Clostridia bacterium]
LDPLLEYIPDYILEKNYKLYGNTFEAAEHSIFEFNKDIIDAIYDIVPAIKPQSAYYEMYGWQGVRALHNTIKYAKHMGMYVIVDVKRNDIGSTAGAYAKAYLGDTSINGDSLSAFSADSVTINGYLGSDGILPFYEQCKLNNKSIFALVKTSNPSSGELQDLILSSGETVYKKMINLYNEISKDSLNEYGFTSIGAVVGATYPAQLTELRNEFPNIFFLVPGYGAQGGGANDIAGAFNDKGLGGIVNSSRAVMCAYKKGNYLPEEFAKAARDEVIRMKNDLLNVIK